MNKNKNYKPSLFLGLSLFAAIIIAIYQTGKLNTTKIQLSSLESKNEKQFQKIDDYNKLIELSILKLTNEDDSNRDKIDTLFEELSKNQDSSFLNTLSQIKKNGLQNEVKIVEVINEVKVDEDIYKQIEIIDSAYSTTQEKLQQTQVELNNAKAKIQELLVISSQPQARKDTITITSLKGNKIQYFGEVTNGKAHGYGVGFYESGSIYKGEWKENIRYGKGVFMWKDGEKYVGDYKNDLRNGFGIYYWKNGERYEGHWQDDYRQGYGTLYKPNGSIKDQGEWFADKLQ